MNNRLVHLICLLGIAVCADAQTAISPGRRIDWSAAGVPGGIPVRTSICATLTPGVTAAQINNAISFCPSGGVVALVAGTYNLSTGIVFNNKSNVTLRGSGPDQTFIKFTNGSSCGGLGGDLCIINSDPDCAGCGSPSNAANWTAGYAPGTTVITLGPLTKGSTELMTATSGLASMVLRIASLPSTASAITSQFG